jgi:hypothetical protein
VEIHFAEENWWKKLQPFTGTLFFVALLIILALLDQLIVTKIYAYTSGSILNWLFLDGGWISGAASIVTILVFKKHKFALWIFFCAITYAASIVYFYQSGLAATSKDPLGAGGVAIVWMLNWFWGGAIGFAIHIGKLYFGTSSVHA